KTAPSAPRPRLWRGFATVGRVWPRGHSWPLGQIGAIPRAARVRGTRLIRPPFAAALEGESEEQKSEGARRWVLAFAGTTKRFLLLRQGLPRSALPGPLSAA